jgi:hypothetical protein
VISWCGRSNFLPRVAAFEFQKENPCSQFQSKAIEEVCI